MHTNFRHLFYLVHVAELGSITAASEKIGISQPGISAAIKSVEDQVGYQLFIRNPSQGLSLTQAGRQFIKHAKHLLNDVQSFEKFATGLGSELTGQLQIGCYSVIAPYLIPRLLTAFRSSYPNVSITIYETDLAETINQLKNGLIDIAITYDFIKDDAIDYEVLFEASPHVILSSEDQLSKKSSISLKELCDKPLILLDFEYFYEHMFAMHDLKPNILYRLKSFEIIRGLVGTGLGYSFGRLPIKVEHTYDGHILIRRTLKEDVPKSRVCIASPHQSRPIRVVETFVSTCRLEFSDTNMSY